MAERLSRLDRLKRDIIELEDEDAAKILAWLEAVVAVRKEDRERVARRKQPEIRDLNLGDKDA